MVYRRLESSSKKLYIFNLIWPILLNFPGFPYIHMPKKIEDISYCLHALDKDIESNKMAIWLEILMMYDKYLSRNNKQLLQQTIFWQIYSKETILACTTMIDDQKYCSRIWNIGWFIDLQPYVLRKYVLHILLYFKIMIWIYASIKFAK